jgi:peroxiredoxin
VAKRLSQEAGYGFTFLSDATLETIRRYDVLGESGTMPRPAAFLIDPGATVRWRAVTDSMFVRARPESILEAASHLR